MKQLPVLFLLLLLTGVLPARADGADDAYVTIYNTMQEAENLESNGQGTRALAKYVEAQTALQRFQRIYPDWNVKLVNFRLSNVASRIAALSTQPAAPGAAPMTQSAPGKAPTTPPPATAQRSPPVADTQQLDSLRGQVRQLQADKILLEAKLKESLSAQPASLDPREMARAQEKTKSLLKENELLKVDLDQAKTRADPKALLQAQLALAEANRQLADQSEKSKALEAEKAALQTRLNTLAAGARNATAADNTRRELDDANRQLAQQKELAVRLASEKETLQQRLNGLSTNNEAADVLRLENQILKKQLADLRAAGTSPDKSAEASRQLAAAQAQIATLQSDKELLRMEKIVLENKMRKLSTATATATPQGSSSTIASTVLPAPGRAQDTARIKQLEGERDALQKQLTTANKELYGRKGQAAANRMLEMENQMAVLRARLEIFEARQMPYSTEELALFQKPETKIAANPNTGKKPISELPAGSATLVADAQRLFAARLYDRAAEKYTQILHQDEKNVPTLANLAAIEMAADHLEPAEKHAQQAVALAPEDAYSLGILGQIKFRQEKFEEALDALSKAAKLDPDNATIQNLLGLTLSEKGLRGPAENALRKAIQLQPGYGDAHANLAVVYITQHPPLVELARWHYQKALAAGNRPNPYLEKILNAPRTADAKGSGPGN